jgi:hypothetical protein
MAGAALSLGRRSPPHFQGATIDLLALAGYRHLQAPADGPHLVTVVAGVDINIWVASHLGLSLLLRGGLGRDLRPGGRVQAGRGRGLLKAPARPWVWPLVASALTWAPVSSPRTTLRYGTCIGMRI